MTQPTFQSGDIGVAPSRSLSASLPRIHSFLGWSFLVIFLMTGGYLRWIFPDAYTTDDAIRYVFRANHVYILFSSLLNILASHMEVRTDKLLYRRLRIAGSALLVLAPPVLLAAFLLETTPAVPYRPLTLIGAFAALIGVLLLDRARRERLF